MNKNTKNLLYTLLKITLTLLFLYLVFSKMPFSQVWNVFVGSEKGYLFLALLSFVTSQVVSAKRLLVFFKEASFLLSSKTNYQLYLVGMFYNFFIPGGVGGDAYKVYVLNKKFDWSIKKIGAIVFLDRFMGLTAIGILIVTGFFFVPYVSKINLNWILIVLIVIGLFASFQFVNWFFPFFKRVFQKTLLQSLLVQILQCLCVYLLLKSINPEVDYWVYLLVFLISSVLSIFSFAGIGVRELIFYWAATYFVYNAAIAVTIALLFSVFTALISFFGVYFQFRKPALILDEN